MLGDGFLRGCNLNSTLVSLLAFACTFGASLIAIFIRGQLPPHHVEGDSKDVVKLVLGLIATLTALVLGLLISSAHTAYDAQQAELQQLSVQLFEIDRLLAHYGPDAAEQRTQLRQLVAGDIARIWPAEGVGGAGYAPPSAQHEAERLVDGLEGLSPKTDQQRLVQS